MSISNIAPGTNTPRMKRDATRDLMLVAARQFAEVDGCLHPETMQEAIRAITFAARAYYRASKEVMDIEAKSNRPKRAIGPVSTKPLTLGQVVRHKSDMLLGAAFLYGEADLTGHPTNHLIENLARAAVEYDDAVEAVEKAPGGNRTRTDVAA